MALIDITSANATLFITVPGYFSSGFYVNDWQSDRMFDTAALQNKEEQMSADGKYHVGLIFNTTNLALHLMPTSSAGQRFDELFAAERAALTAYTLNAVLSIPSIDATYNFVNGTLFNWVPAVGAGRVLAGRDAELHFESVTRS